MHEVVDTKLVLLATVLPRIPVLCIPYPKTMNIHMKFLSPVHSAFVARKNSIQTHFAASDSGEDHGNIWQKHKLAI